MGWGLVIDKGVNALKSGGLFVSVEPEMKNWLVVSPDMPYDSTHQQEIPSLSDEESQRLAPGCVNFRNRLRS
jgi:hypothetical protein